MTTSMIDPSPLFTSFTLNRFQPAIQRGSGCVALLKAAGFG